MKKRIISLLLIISMLLTVLPANKVYAQEDYSQWAFDDLVVGDTYNIYPQSWYEKSMRAPITHGQLRVLLAGMRVKILKTDAVVDYNERIYKLSNNMTVKEVLEFLYTLISDYEFSGDIGIAEGQRALDYMAKYGVFTGNEGELSLDDICTVEQACVIAARLITHLYDALDAASKGFLWEINSGANKVYLLGSIHIANYDIYPFSKTMLDAFTESDVLGVEVNLLDTSVDTNSLYAKYGMYTDGTTLKDHVPEATYTRVVQIGSLFGLSEDLIAMFKPWVLFNTFVGLANTSSGTMEEAVLAQSLGIDIKFMYDAVFTSKPIIELESYEFQLQVLDSFSDELELYLLETTLDAIYYMLLGPAPASEGTGLVDIMLKYWHEGDAESFLTYIAPILVESEIPDVSDEDREIAALMEEYYHKIFTERDLGMAKKIDQFLKADGSTTYFIVVGTGHYISDYSVIDILRDMGYEINQIK